MAVDRYTKAVLTAIAIVLVWLSLGGPALLPTVTAQQAGVGRFEYLMATPYYTSYREGQSVGTLTAYSACAAQATGWTCRKFEAPSTLALSRPDDHNPAFRALLATLGSEGWELAAAVDDSPTRDNELTYLFKRRQ